MFRDPVSGMCNTCPPFFKFNPARGICIPNCPDGLTSKKLLELSGNSESTLKWSTMEQTLDCGGIDTIAIPISNEVYNNLEALRQKSILCFNDPPPVPDYELEEGENPMTMFPTYKECLLFWVTFFASLILLLLLFPLWLPCAITGFSQRQQERLPYRIFDSIHCKVIAYIQNAIGCLWDFVGKFIPKKD